MALVLCPYVTVLMNGWGQSVTYHVCTVQSFLTSHVSVMAAILELVVMTHVEDMENVWTITVSAVLRMDGGVSCLLQ